MDIQTAQPPPYHFMFDASAHALGTGAPMEVSKYPGAQPEQYRSGFRQFKPVPGRGLVFGPSGNWGNKHYYKYTPIKQHDGASGVLSQIEQPNAYKYKVANLGRLGRVDPQLPRGGSIMRIVGTAGDGSEDMRAFDSNYDWRGGGGGGGEMGPPDLRPPTDVGRPDLPGIKIAVEKPPVELQEAKFYVMNGIPSTGGASGPSTGPPTPPPEQIPTNPILPPPAPPGDFFYNDSDISSPMSVDVVRNINDVVDMEIDEFNKQLIELRGGRSVISTSDSWNVKSRTMALIIALRDQMIENDAELPANVLTELGEIIESLTEVLAEFDRGEITAENLWQHIIRLVDDYQNAVAQAAGGDSGASTPRPPQIQSPGGTTTDLAVRGPTDVATTTRRRDSASSKASSQDTDTSRSKTRRRNDDTFDTAAQRRKAVNVRVPSIMSSPATTPAKAKRQADWLTRTIDNVAGEYLTDAQKNMISRGISEYVLNLVREGATNALASFIDRIVRTLQLPGNPREIARKIVMFVERRLQG